MEKIKVGVVGATGYAGAEICRLIAGHPAAELAAISTAFRRSLLRSVTKKARRSSTSARTSA